MERDEIFRDDQERPAMALPSEALLDDQFRVGRVLGAGGFGMTYLAFDEVLEVTVAVKEYFPQHLAVDRTSKVDVQPRSTQHEEDFRFGLDRFLEEARTLAKFEDHPNIVRVRTFFEENGTGYLVMNYYDGRTLDGYLKQRGGQLPEDEALFVMHNVLDGLREVHDAGILHRDVDPSNVYLADKGRVVLLDFGAARNAIGERTQTLSVMLKRGYAPHEQYHSRGSQGPWTDVYACAATLYRVLTGYKPPEAPARIMNEELVPPLEIAPNLSAELCEALMVGLAIKPADRPQSIAEFQDLLPPRPDASVARWTGDAAPSDDAPPSDGSSEIVLETAYPCRVYLDGKPSTSLTPGDEPVTLNVSPGNHQIRAVRTDLSNEGGTATVTSSTPDDHSGAMDGDHVSLDSLIWQIDVVASPDAPSHVLLSFDPADDDSASGDGAVRESLSAPTTDASSDASSDDDTQETTGDDVSTELAQAQTAVPDETETPPPNAQDAPSPQEEAASETKTTAAPDVEDSEVDHSDADSADTEGSNAKDSGVEDSSAADSSAADSGASTPDLGAVDVPDEAMDRVPDELPDGVSVRRLVGAAVVLLLVSLGGWVVFGNEAPVTSPDDAVSDSSGTVVTVTANDRDPDVQSAGVGLRLVDVTPLPDSVGTVSIVDSARLRFRPAPSFGGRANVQYTVADAADATASGTARILVPFAAQPVVVSSSFGDPQTVSADDADGDGRKDLLVASYTGASVVLFPSGPDARYRSSLVLDDEAGGALDVSFADLDGDGDSDALATAFRDSTVSWYENRSGDSLDFAPRRDLSRALPGALSARAGDVDGDGRTDVVAASRIDGTIVWFRNLGDGGPRFDDPQLLADDVDGLESMLVTDLDGDGDPDVLGAAYDANTVLWMENDGTGSFTRRILDDDAPQVLSVYAADLDGDDRKDILAGLAGTDRVVWYRQTDAETSGGAAAFDDARVVSPDVEEPEAVRAADVDGDGDRDVLTASFDSGRIDWHPNRGEGLDDRFGPPFLLTDDAPEALDVLATDLDGDGDVDVATVSQGDNTIAYFEGHTASE